ncbi:MAG: translation initiation factor eIF-1A [archaeon]|jgi:translation initiation factor 1A|nr:translation initiation factor eIF-1A [archaeon]
MAEENNEYGEFEEIKEEGTEKNVLDESGMPVRVRMPRKGEVIGVVTQRYGGNRMEVHCTDGKKRNCRVPGRFKRSLWLRPKDIVMVAPWPDDDTKADIIYKYSSSGINQLRKKGLLKNLQEGF